MASNSQQAIQIRMDRDQARAVEKRLEDIKRGAPTAMSRAINHTLGITRTEAGQEIRKQVALKAGYVRERLRIKRATVSAPVGAIRTPKRGILLTRYQHRQYKNGDIGVKVKPGRGFKRMEGAFFIGPLSNSGAMAIAFRNQYGPGLGRTEGLRFTYGPSVSQVFSDVKDDLAAPSSERLMQRLDHEATRLLRQ